MPTHVLVYLPEGFARMLRLNRAPALSDLAYRILDPLCRRTVDPTVDAVAEHYEISRSRAAAALRSLERNGLLRRWRRSYGRGYWTHFYVLTDEPFAWLDDVQLQGKITHTEDQAAAYAQRVTGYANEPLFPVPVAAPGSTEPTTPPEPPESPRPSTALGRGGMNTTGLGAPLHAESRASNSNTINSEVTNRFSLEGELPPLPPGGQTIHSRNNRPERTPRRTKPRSYSERIAQVVTAIPPESQQWLPAAVRITSGLLDSPLARAQWLPVVVEALASGRSEQDLQRYLGTDYETARSVAACLRSRLGWLRQTLTRERTARLRADGGTGAGPNG